MSRLVRGRVYLADIGLPEPKPVLVVSNNARNRNLPSVLAARVTTTAKPQIPSIVALAPADAPLVGNVLCDDVIEIYDEDVVHELGALSARTMARVGDGLREAFAL